MLAVSSVGATFTLLPWGMAADRIGDRVTGSSASSAPARGSPRRGTPRGSRRWSCSLTLSGRIRRQHQHRQRPRRDELVPAGAARSRARDPPDRRFRSAASRPRSAVPAIADHWGSKAALVALAAFSLLGAALAAALLVEGPVRSDGRGRDRRAAPSDPRPADLAALVRQFGADLHAGRGHGLHRPLPRVATRLLGDRGRPRAGGDQRRRRGRAPVVRPGVRPPRRRTGGADPGDRGWRGRRPLRRGGPGGTSSWLLVPVIAIGGGLAMSWNGLAVAATVESAGPRRRGAALGLQQTVIGVARRLRPARLRAARGRDLVAGRLRAGRRGAAGGACRPPPARAVGSTEAPRSGGVGFAGTGTGVGIRPSETLPIPRGRP